MSDHNPNTTAEEFITQLHITISQLDDGELRTEMIDYLMNIKDQIQTLEESYNQPTHEAHRRL